jgi:hypothetical protein
MKAGDVIALILQHSAHDDLKVEVVINGVATRLEIADVERRNDGSRTCNFVGPVLVCYPKLVIKELGEDE